MNFGCGRAEPLGALFNCFTIWGLTVYLILEAWKRLWTPFTLDRQMMLITSAIGVVANLTMAAVVHGPGVLILLIKYPCMSSKAKEAVMQGGSEDNLSIKTVMAHIQGDLVYSLGVLIAATAIYISEELIMLDPILTLLFSLIVLHITIPVCKESLLVLCEGNTDNVKYRRIRKKVLSTSGVARIHSLRLWTVGPDQTCANIHVGIHDYPVESIQTDIELVLKDAGIDYWTVQTYNKNQACSFNDDY